MSKNDRTGILALAVQKERELVFTYISYILSGL
jgi:hypothetical protein